MKKMTCIVLIFLLVSLLLLGCSTNGSKIITKDQYISQNKLTQDVITTEIDISKITNLDFSRNINDVTKKNGVYGYNYTNYKGADKERKSLILFNGVDGSYSDITFSLKSNVLTVNYKYNAVEGINKKSLFMIEDMNKDGSYETLALNNNGKSDIFVNITGLPETE